MSFLDVNVNTTPGQCAGLVDWTDLTDPMQSRQSMLDESRPGEIHPIAQFCYTRF